MNKLHPYGIQLCLREWNTHPPTQVIHRWIFEPLASSKPLHRRYIEMAEGDDDAIRIVYEQKYHDRVFIRQGFFRKELARAIYAEVKRMYSVQPVRRMGYTILEYGRRPYKTTVGILQDRIEPRFLERLRERGKLVLGDTNEPRYPIPL